MKPSAIRPHALGNHELSRGPYKEDHGRRDILHRLLCGKCRRSIVRSGFRSPECLMAGTSSTSSADRSCPALFESFFKQEQAPNYNLGM